MTDHKYLNGFGNNFESEAEPGALPQKQNSPQKPPLGLYAEQFSGSAFTAPRAQNRKTWFYRIRPSVVHPPFERYKMTKMDSSFLTSLPEPNQMRWDPLPKPIAEIDFVDGLTTWIGNGDWRGQSGCAIHLYSITKPMTDRYFFNCDGEMLIVPEKGTMEINTECGRLSAAPGEIAVIPRGMKFQVVISEWSRGYVCENFGMSFRLPELGPIGANGLANPRDFRTPLAWYENRTGDIELVNKFAGHFFSTQLEHAPLDVVAWHGNCVPYVYDLRLFNTINTVSFDHPDPSIFTVLTSPSAEAGVANIDFAIFPARWMVAKDTFRPPYFHRNVMSEFMGLIYGAYDAKEEGFVPGGSSLHNCMAAHGPDNDAWQKATEKELLPEYLDSTLAFMWESRHPFGVSEFARTNHRQFGYYQCWQDLKPMFNKK